MPSTRGMKGGGYYDAHSSPQRQALEPYVAWLESAVREWDVPGEPGAPIRMLDLGSSEGANAIYAYGRIVDALRSRTDAPVAPVLSDLPTSDYQTLVRNLYAGEEDAFPQPAVYPSITAGSAYGELVAPGSIQIATSLNMLGWLSKRPPNGLPRYTMTVDPSPYAVGADYALEDEELTEIRAQAAADVVAFLRARATELVPGGLLLVQTFGTGDVHSCAHGIADAFHDTLVQLVADGIVSEETRRDFFITTYYRRLHELLAPLKNDSELRACFEVLRAESLESPVSFNQAFERDGDVAAWARAYAGFVRALSESSLVIAFERSGQDASVVDAVYERLESLLREDPERYRFRYFSVGALLRRV